MASNFCTFCLCIAQYVCLSRFTVAHLPLNINFFITFIINCVVGVLHAFDSFTFSMRFGWKMIFYGNSVLKTSLRLKKCVHIPIIISKISIMTGYKKNNWSKENLNLIFVFLLHFHLNEKKILCGRSDAMKNDFVCSCVEASHYNRIFFKSALFRLRGRWIKNIECLSFKLYIQLIRLQLNRTHQIIDHLSSMEFWILGRILYARTWCVWFCWPIALHGVVRLTFSLYLGNHPPYNLWDRNDGILVRKGCSHLWWQLM